MRNAPESAGERVPNLAPMVDVIMVLLVFFLLGASLNVARQGVLQTELDPSSGPGGNEAVTISPSIRIGLRDVGDGARARVELNDVPLGELVEQAYDVSLERSDGQRAALVDYFGPLFVRLEQAAAAGADRENPIVIGAETTVRWKYVAKAMDAAVKAGFKIIQFAVSFAAREPGAEMP
jgi:biopolymer transport protein ExbD